MLISFRCMMSGNLDLLLRQKGQIPFIDDSLSSRDYNRLGFAVQLALLRYAGIIRKGY